jgi:hypothetical protein
MPNSISGDQLRPTLPNVRGQLQRACDCPRESIRGRGASQCDARHRPRASDPRASGLEGAHTSVWESVRTFTCPQSSLRLRNRSSAATTRLLHKTRGSCPGSKIYAAEHETTVNSLVRELLQEKLTADRRTARRRYQVAGHRRPRPLFQRRPRFDSTRRSA